MFKIIKRVFGWRIRLLNQKRLLTFWKIKQTFNFSRKENVNKLSIVVVGRNDNYGGDFSKRLQTTLDWNLNLIPHSELIYIEWNQINNRKSDCEWISKRYKDSKCYIISEEIHKNISTNPNMPLMEYHAKNLGIRKATNDWILLVNADVFLGQDVVKNMRVLSKKRVYGTHYNNIIWNENPIGDNTFVKENIKNSFSANKKLQSVVGNFILTHKNNWLKASGYDESLTMVRAGVDTNGLNQLFYLGLKPMVLGHHYHLDHNESMINCSNLTHGSHKFDNIPYKNPENWGMTDYNEIKISDSIWELKEI